MAALVVKPAPPRIWARHQVQKRRTQQVLRLGKLVLCPHTGAAGGHHGFTHQKLQLRPGPVRQAKVDASVYRLELEIKLRQPRGQVDGDAGVRTEKLRQARRQPACAKSGQDGQIEAAALRVGAKTQGGVGDAHERAANLQRIGLPCGAEAHGLALAHKQLGTQPLFQRPDLPADGALRQVQLPRSSRKALVAGRCLKGAQQGHGR